MNKGPDRKIVQDFPQHNEEKMANANNEEIIHQTILSIKPYRKQRSSTPEGDEDANEELSATTASPGAGVKGSASRKFSQFTGFRISSRLSGLCVKSEEVAVGEYVGDAYMGVEGNWLK